MIREYTIAIETPEGTTTDEDVLGRFHEAMTAAPQALGASALLDHEREVISSRFQVEADALDTAQEIGLRIFADALRAAGVTSGYEVVEASEGPIVG